MKKWILTSSSKFVASSALIVISVACSVQANAQLVQAGLRAGVNVSNWSLSGETDILAKSRIAPELGAYVAIRIAKSLAIEPGIAYSNGGTTLKYIDGSKSDVRLSYLQIPILARFSLTRSFSLFAGPQLGLLMKATATNNDHHRDNIKSILKSDDLALIAGLQYNLPAGIGIGLKYTAGLKDIYTSEAVNVKNYSFGLLLSYELRPAKRR